MSIFYHNCRSRPSANFSTVLKLQETGFYGLKGAWRHKLFFLSWLLIFLWSGSQAAAFAKQEYPLRSFYPHVQTISTDRLLEISVDALIVDVRDRFGFDVIHFSEAYHIPYSAAGFLAALSEHRALHSEIPLVFYANDSASTSAFRAALLVQSAGYNNVFVYDSGIFALLERMPEKITLMATAPAQPERVIPHGYAEKVFVDFQEFRQRSTRLNGLVIDIRDISTRDYALRLQDVRNIPLEAFLNAVANRIWFGKNLLIFDRDGKKVKWLQYFLLANGYTNYLFLRGGIEGVEVTRKEKTHQLNSWVTLNQQSVIELAKDTTLSTLDLQVLHLLAGSISYKHYALVPPPLVPAALHCSTAEFRSAVNHLRKRGYLLFSEQENSMVFHLTPRLFWKGSMSGAAWADSVREFDAAISQPGAVQ